MSDQSTKMFMNVVREKHDQFNARFNDLLQVLPDNDQAKKHKAVESLHGVAQALSSVLASNDRPAWLNETIAATNDFLRKNRTPKEVSSGSGSALLLRLMKTYGASANHAWTFEDTPASKAYDFDAVFEQCRDASNLDTLFSDMVTTLDKMVRSGEIDSIRAVEALRELMATLDANKKGSYFSTVVTWEFIQSFLGNAMWEALESVPLVGPLKKAFEKTAKEFGVELSNVNAQIGDELRKRFGVDAGRALADQSLGNQLLDDDESGEAIGPENDQQ